MINPFKIPRGFTATIRTPASEPHNNLLKLEWDKVGSEADAKKRVSRAVKGFVSELKHCYYSDWNGEAWNIYWWDQQTNVIAVTLRSEVVDTVY